MYSKYKCSLEYSLKQNSTLRNTFSQNFELFFFLASETFQGFSGLKTLLVCFCSHRRSTEDRPGTPTVDERNLESGSTAIAQHSHSVPAVHSVPALVTPGLPDVSVPPPGMGPPSSYHSIPSIGTGPQPINRNTSYNAYGKNLNRSFYFKSHPGTL